MPVQVFLLPFFTAFLIWSSSNNQHFQPHISLDLDTPESGTFNVKQEMQPVAMTWLSFCIIMKQEPIILDLWIIVSDNQVTDGTEKAKFLLNSIVFPTYCRYIRKQSRRLNYHFQQLSSARTSQNNRNRAKKFRSLLKISSTVAVSDQFRICKGNYLLQFRKLQMLCVLKLCITKLLSLRCSYVNPLYIGNIG